MSENVDKMPPVPPFVQFVAAAVPMVFDDSLSYYEALCALWKYISGMTSVINNNATLEEEYIEKFEQLKSFVDNYFANLDVQEEINNKLDEMAEDGTLADIISQYLNSTAIFGYDTVADMKDAENLTNGSYARTLGYYAKNDGGGGLYKIRTITNDDTIDEAFIIEMNDTGNTLVAELIIENDTVNFRQLGAKNEEDTSYAHTDCKTYLDKYIAKLNEIGDKTISLFIPSGIWCFSATHINRKKGFNIYGEKSYVISTVDTQNTTIIAPVANNQQHIWKIGGNADYSTSVSSMVYNWSLNNLIFSTAQYTTGREISTLFHVTKASLYLDCVTAGRSEFLQFGQVDGTALAIASSWEVYFGTLNFRRVYDFNSPAFLFDSKRTITGIGSPDISAIDIQNIMFEGINGDMIYTKDDCEMAELQIGNINAESRLVQETGTEQGTIISNNSSKTADYHCAMFNVGRAVGVMINQIKVSNFVNWKFTSTDTGYTYINDRLFTLRENAFYQFSIDKITSNFNRAKLTIAYKPANYYVNKRSRLHINCFEAFTEALEDNTPLFEVYWCPFLTIDKVLNSMYLTRYELGSIPIYQFGVDNRVVYNAESQNINHLALARQVSGGENLAILTGNNNYDLVFRIKAKSGVNGKINWRGTEAGGSESYHQGVSYTGTGAWQYVKLTLPALEPNTRLVIADVSSNYVNDDDCTIYDSISLVEKSA